MDEKFWPSISALHWMATFLDPTFKQMEFIPEANADDVSFKQNMPNDLDTWMMQELNPVVEKMNKKFTEVQSDRL